MMQQPCELAHTSVSLRPHTHKSSDVPFDVASLIGRLGTATTIASMSLAGSCRDLARVSSQYSAASTLPEAGQLKPQRAAI
jgi:hypothetical protein